MNISAASIDKQIYDYLTHFNLNQKKALLTIVKKIADNVGENQYSDEFKAELDSRYEEYLNGTAKFYSEDDVKKQMQEIFNNRAKK